MGGFKEYDKFDGMGLAELVRKKEVSPEELCEEAISRIEKLNPGINAVVTPMYEIARQKALSLPDGPFKGVPFLLKDLLADCEGVPLSNGCRAYKDVVSKKDSEIVKRYKNTGLNILGKTNTPEFGLMGVTEPEIFGPCRNPWNPDYTPGGSSGGSAAAVASCMVPFASGGDGGGSIRIPASCCGLFGLKPSRGRTPSGPDNGRVWQGAAIEHVISRSVRDSAALLDYTMGPDAGAPYHVSKPERPYLEEVGRDPGRLNIAFSTISPVNGGVHGECVRAVENTAKLLESLGHNVENCTPDIDGYALARSYMMLYMGEIPADLEKIGSDLGRKFRKRDVETGTWIAGNIGKKYSASDFVKALRNWDIAARKMGQFHLKYDLYLTPVLAYPPVKIGEFAPNPLESLFSNIIIELGLVGLLKAAGLFEKYFMHNISWAPFTQVANFTGQPAMSVPLHWTEDGLPVGVQFIAPIGDEASLFRIAGQLESAMPWFDKRPPL